MGTLALLLPCSELSAIWRPKVGKSSSSSRSGPLAETRTSEESGSTHLSLSLSLSLWLPTLLLLATDKGNDHADRTTRQDVSPSPLSLSLLFQKTANWWGALNSLSRPLPVPCARRPIEITSKARTCPSYTEYSSCVTHPSL